MSEKKTISLIFVNSTLAYPNTKTWFLIFLCHYTHFTFELIKLILGYILFIYYEKSLIFFFVIVL